MSDEAAAQRSAAAQKDNSLGTGLGDKWRAAQGHSGWLKDKRKRAGKPHRSAKNKGGKRASSYPPPTASTSMVRRGSPVRVRQRASFDPAWFLVLREEMREEPYESEDVLQRLLADFPQLLAGEEFPGDEPRRFRLVAREPGVPGEEGGSGRWSLDHLFLDQAGIPTLVEVKRSSDTRARREVVAQMLDYAAKAVVYWPAEQIREPLRTQPVQQPRRPLHIREQKRDCA